MKLKLPKILLLIFLFYILIIRAKFSSVCAGVCKENEQQALETLKKQVKNPYLFSTWIAGNDCCEWEGVVCHNLTHHVTELRIQGDWDISVEIGLSINNLDWLPSLVNLEILLIDSVDLRKATDWLQVINMLPSLVELRLYGCGLHHIPPSLDHHNFSSLQTLHLSLNKFSSSVPKWIFSLPTLVSLDLSDSNFIGPFPEGPVNSTSLTTFRAYSNSFNSPLPKWLFDLHDLETLNLYNCGIKGEISNLVSNLRSVTHIDLSNNVLYGKIPNAIGKLWKLEYLGLSRNLFEGEVYELFNSTASNCFQPGLRNCSSLKELRLADNKLTGPLPRSLGRLSMLEHFDISDNMLEGIVTESHFTNLTQLKQFVAHKNHLTLKVSKNWTPPFQATVIKIGGWNLGPQFPMWLQTQKQIEDLDISYSGIKGAVPAWFWNLTSQMESLSLSHNQLVGEVPNISTLSPLTFMDFASNNFSGPLPRIPTTVLHLDLSNNSFSGGLSHFLCEGKNNSYRMWILNLGANNLSGDIPNCWMNWTELTVLILRDNNLIGGIPRSMEVLRNLESVDLRRNSLTGPFSLSLGNCTKLHKIDLAENEFVGTLPSWLGMRLSSLIILSLRSNKFYGELPQEICHLKDLHILDLANNNFFGIIPRCISNLTAMVTLKKVVETDIELAYFSDFEVLVRESAMVTTKGNMYQYDTILTLLTSMDMSSNNLSGDIPISLTRLVGLRSCNFSNNQLTGMIPNSIGDMKVLESFDLSENQLSGQIPPSFAILTTLSFLNLSYNNLSGAIPVSTQLQSFSPSSFQGNKLCGLPLLKNCGSNSKIPNHENKEEESNEDDELDWFYISMAIGFGLSFWGVGAPLIFMTSWRHAYFRFLDSGWNSLRAKVKV